VTTRPANRTERIVPSDEDMQEVEHRPSLMDLKREAARARVKGDLHRAHCMRLAIIARVFRAQRAAAGRRS
jgi:hypothetical protein